MWRYLLTLILAGLAVSCSYDFNVETDHFTCDSSSDCIDGYVCADYVVEEGDVTSYCVKKENARLGAFLTWSDSTATVTSPPCNLENTQVAAKMATGDDLSHFGADDSWNSGALEGAQCTGSLTTAGVFTAFCSAPVDVNDVPAAVAIWAVAYDTTFDASDEITWWVHGFGSGAPAAENPLIQPYPPTIDGDKSGVAVCRKARRTACTTPPTQCN